MKKRTLFFSMSIVIFSMTELLGIDLKTPVWQKVIQSGKENCYTFLYFNDSKTTEPMLTIINEIKNESNKVKKSIDIIKITANSSEERTLLEYFKVKEYPTVIVIAPNEAITGYFTKTVEKKALLESIVSPKEAEIIKYLQEGKAIFLCFYGNEQTKSNTIRTDIEAVANNFKGAVRVTYAKISDRKENKFKEKLRLSSNDQTTVFIIIPPGRMVGKLAGNNITKENLMRTLYSSCSPGSCSPGSCK